MHLSIGNISDIDCGLLRPAGIPMVDIVCKDVPHKMTAISQSHVY